MFKLLLDCSKQKSTSKLDSDCSFKYVTLTVVSLKVIRELINQVYIKVGRYTNSLKLEKVLQMFKSG